MIVLVIDTALGACTAAVFDGERPLGVRSEAMTKGHSERLGGFVRDAMAEAGIGFEAVERIGVTVGPGSFTGLRVGMATAAAFGHALGIPVYGVCSLDAIAAGTTGEVLVVTVARRREVYWARYRDGVRVDGPAVNAATDVPAGAAGLVGVAGSPEHAALFDLPRLAPVSPSATGLVAAVADWDSEPEPLVPLYLRRPDAKPSAVKR